MWRAEEDFSFSGNECVAHTEDSAEWVHNVPVRSFLHQSTVSWHSRVELVLASCLAKKSVFSDYV